jgi:lysozyme
MTTPFLLDDLKRDEGLRLKAYPDALSGGAPWTIGYGHTGAGIRRGVSCTLAEAEAWLETDVLFVEARLDAQIQWWRSLDDVRQDVLVEMAFNLGVLGLLKFEVTLTDVRRGCYGQAAAAMLFSEWARQVGDRAMRLSILMKTGVRPRPEPQTKPQEGDRT